MIPKLRGISSKCIEDPRIEPQEILNPDYLITEESVIEYKYEPAYV